MYKYFGDVEAILLAWHERQVGAHLALLSAVRDTAREPVERLKAVLEAFALISHESHGGHDRELAAFLHRDEKVVQAQRHLHEMVRDLLDEGVRAGEIRADVSSDELAGYCLHALTAARGLPSQAAVRRLVAVTLAGLRP
ncbi:hypothetical protein [Saccharothrix sp.]|uniref:SbtR family transcriptional regulator n=1 Tax=Saccharothrix sp. TaxID=1873460 RepID=UPI0028114ABC|nr:hypothetical protein [Saccharothrix sp.]